jgi:hypothetical protein
MSGFDVQAVYVASKEYLESFQLAANSKISQLFELALGEKGKNISLVDGVLVLLSTAGAAVFYSSPQTGVALFTMGAVPLAGRRGTQAAFTVPLVLVTAIENPL